MNKRQNKKEARKRSFNAGKYLGVYQATHEVYGLYTLKYVTREMLKRYKSERRTSAIYWCKGWFKGVRNA